MNFANFAVVLFRFANVSYSHKPLAAPGGAGASLGGGVDLSTVFACAILRLRQRNKMQRHYT